MNTAGNDPDQIRRSIERTQSDLCTNVNAVAEKVSPGRIMERRVDRVRSAAGRVRDTVMGNEPGEAAHRQAQHLADTASSAASTVSGGASGAAHTVRETPERARDLARHETKGNPIAAGIIAFGVGWLVSSVLPASSREQQLAGQLGDQTENFVQPAVDAAKQAATEAKEELPGPAQEAADAVQATAADAGRTVMGEARSVTESHLHGS